MGDYSELLFYQKARQVVIGTEYIHYLIIAQGSANKTDHWLHTAIDIGFGIKEKVQIIIELNSKVREESSPYNIEFDSSDD
ncbi:MAG: four helix bundle protein [Chloroflexi bacterium]|nr:four helix bundle protein [Chloroflexota bacterium]